jgi:drug/metabolite transporter (DMT)-like permease
MSRGEAIAIFAGLGGMIGWGFADFFAKRTIDQIGDLATLFWSQLIGVVPILGVLLVVQDVPSLRGFDPVYLVLFGIVSGLSYLPLYSGFGKGQISVLSPIFASYSALVVLLSVVLFRESVPGRQWLAIAVVFAGVLLVSADPRYLGRIARGREHVAAAGVREVLLALIVYSFWLVLLDRFIHGRAWVLFVLVIRSVAVLTLAAYALGRQRGLRVDRPGMWPYLVLVGCCDVAAYSAVAYGFSASSHVSIVAMLSSAFSLPTLLLARVFLKERLTSVQKASACLILGGIALVSAR